MPKVFGFLGKLGLLNSKKLAAPTTGPFVDHHPKGKKSYRASRHHSFIKHEKQRIVTARHYAIARRKRARLLQKATSKTIKNWVLDLKLEAAQDLYQKSLAEQRAVSAANLQRELAEIGGGE